MNKTTQNFTDTPSPRKVCSWGRSAFKFVMRLIDLLVVTVAAIALFAFAARFSWAADLCCQFRVQLLMFLAPVTVFYWIGRRGAFAWFVLMCTVANLLPLVPYLVPKASLTANLNGPVTRVMMLNVLKSNKHYDDVVDYVHEHSPAIFVALEADQKWTEGLKPIRPRYPYRHIIDDRGTSSIAVYSQIPFDRIDVLYSTRHKLPSLDLSVTIDQQPIHVVATHPYVPLTQETARMRNEQLKEIAYLINHEGTRILLGDFNCTPWSPHFVDLVEGTGMAPAGYGTGLRPTWYRRARAYGPLRQTWVFALKLDHVLISDDLTVVDHQIGPCLGSDHRPVMVDFARKDATPRN